MDLRSGWTIHSIGSKLRNTQYNLTTKIGIKIESIAIIPNIASSVSLIFNYKDYVHLFLNGNRPNHTEHSQVDIRA